HAVLIDERTRHPINFLSLPEFLAGRADVAVAFVVIDKVVTRERAVGALGFIEDRDVRLDPPLLHQPSEILGRAVAGIARQPLGPQAEALLRAIDHPTLRGYLSLADRGARLDIDNDGTSGRSDNWCSKRRRPARHSRLSTARRGRHAR